MNDPHPITAYRRGLFTVVGYEHIPSKLVIPAELDGHRIEAIAPNAFLNADKLEELILPDTLLRIEDSAFQGCGALRSIQMPNTLEYIGAFAFADCDQLGQITLPENLSFIPYCCFSTCTALKQIVFPAGLITIGNRAFEECRSLTELSFPSGLREIGNAAFYNCLMLNTPVLPDQISSIGQSAFYRSALSGSAFDLIRLPGSLTLLGAKAFRCTQLNIEGTPEIDGLCSETNVIRAPHMLPQEFAHLSALPAACIGFAEMMESGHNLSERIIDQYNKLLREDPRYLYPAAAASLPLLRYMIRSAMIPKEDIRELIDMCSGNTSALAELLHYSSRFSFSQMEFFCLDEPEND